ncbi:MAG: 30S ribosomal protein S24e [Methanobacteriota archaeon]
MEIQVIDRRDNPLLKRVEVTFKVVHKAEPTPTRDALRAELARALKATKDVVVVDGAASTFGRYETHGYAKVYKTMEHALAVERRHILVRNKLVEAEAKPAEGAPAKPAKPAPPKKEPKAEAKPAAKPEAKAEPKPEKPPGKEKAPSKEEKKEAPKPEKKPEAKKAEPKKTEPKKKEGK